MIPDLANQPAPRNPLSLFVSFCAALWLFHPDAAVEWLEQAVYQAVLGFQEAVADGGSQATLIFWLAGRNRIVHKPSENTAPKAFPSVVAFGTAHKVMCDA